MNSNEKRLTKLREIYESLAQKIWTRNVSDEVLESAKIVAQSIEKIRIFILIEMLEKDEISGIYEISTQNNSRFFTPKEIEEMQNNSALSDINTI